MNEVKRLRVGVIMGGRSGEHEVSLMSARSVLSALDPEKYEITQVGITHDGAWLSGENVLEAMLNGDNSRLQPVFLFPDPTRKGFYSYHAGDRQASLYAQIDVVFPVLHGRPTAPHWWHRNLW